MVPSLLIAVAIFVSFLVVLALIAFAAFRVAAKREGPGLGAAGGCALGAVLIGAGLFAMIGFIVLVGILFAHRAQLHRESRMGERFQENEQFQVDEDSTTDSETVEEHGHDSKDKDDDDGVRQY